ncbi:hypothetical protein CEXT_154941 [Caerostris extrusa]|uniref:Uncharacterized protein n=1 Tax=Caerostris extrusa TaxID=172846 RepID=A0AAV4MFM0_CAEEX|nr:hypothetical protein CEXT_154941 [Caerostris extrusa]
MVPEDALLSLAGISARFRLRYVLQIPITFRLRKFRTLALLQEIPIQPETNPNLFHPSSPLAGWRKGGMFVSPPPD